MLPAPAKLYVCPHCGKTKPVLYLMSGNTFGGELWSDGRTIYPTLPRISAIQKCPSCGKFSLFEKWKDMGKTDCKAIGTTGDLSYLDAKEAYKELKDQNAFQIALFFVHAYNDEFRRPKLRVAFHEDKRPSEVSGHFSSPTKDDVNLFWEASQIVIDYSDNTQDALILKAEIHRERREWVEAFEILYLMHFGDNQWIVDTILYYTCQRDSSLIPFIIGGEKLDYSNKPNFRTLSLLEEPEVTVERKNNIDVYLGSISDVTRKDLYYDILGGVYDKSTNTLLKLVQPSPVRYEIEDETRNIGSFAIFRNEQLKLIRLSSELKTIGTKAFYGCKNLECIRLQKSNIQFIGDCAFMNCKSLRVVNFIDNVRYIGRSAFAGMDELGLVRLPEGIGQIPEFSFFECSYLEIINFPKSLRKICSYSFQHTAFTIINLPNNILELGNAVFSRCFKLVYVRLPKFLKHIPERTFDSCKALRELEIPKNVKRIDKEAFADTIALERVRFYGKVDTVSKTAFKGSGLKEIIVPFVYKTHYMKLFPNVRITTKII